MNVSNNNQSLATFDSNYTCKIVNDAVSVTPWIFAIIDWDHLILRVINSLYGDHRDKGRNYFVKNKTAKINTLHNRVYLYVDKQGGERGSPKCQRNYISLFSKGEGGQESSKFLST